MDPNQPINSIDNQPKKTFSKKTVLIVATYALMLISLPLFVFYSQKQQDIRQNAAEPTQNPITQIIIPSFPIARGLIENPMLSNWSGHIIGRVAKTVPYNITVTPVTQVIAPDGSISLKDTVNGRAYTIFYESPTSKLYKLPQKITDQTLKDAPELKFSDLESGDIINGVVNLVKAGDKWKMVANNINVSSDSNAPSLAKSYILYDNPPDIYTLIRQAPFDTLFANASGSIGSKTTDSFVLVKDTNSITIKVQENEGISTFDDGSEANPLNPAKPHFVDLKVGQTVSGGIGIIVTKQGTLNPGDIVAHLMTIGK